VRFERGVLVAYVVALAVLLAGAVGFRAAVRHLDYYLVKDPVELRAPLDSIPTTLGRWRRVGEDRRFSDAIIEELGTRNYLDRTYAIDGDPRKGTIAVHLAYYTGTIDDVPHIPERCWAVAGNLMTIAPSAMPLEVDVGRWKESDDRNRATEEPYRRATVADPVTGAVSDVSLPVGDLELTVTEFQNPKSPRQRTIGGYLFVANGRLTRSAYGVRALAYERTERKAYYCKVQFNLSGVVASDEGSLIPQYRKDVSELMTELLPQLMKALPDWPSIEAETAGPA
jgi:hypothetical protein